MVSATASESSFVRSVALLTVRSFACFIDKTHVMSVPISIPKLGVSMTEGTLVEWMVSDGQPVQAGDVLYRIETDKVENDVESPIAGVIRIVGVEGETYAVGVQIGSIE
ncbi:unannotated protein [freshwater metagenome]|uniref:Unannotated protein n=1 Tax=freshwater metagenome TaxID=449393 RepID=A0A6J6PQ31_9ZZZZ